MEKKYKALLLDIDGVVVKDAASLPSPRVREAVQRVREAGMIVSLVTGRPLDRTLPIIDILQVSAPVAVEGGARLYSPTEKNDIYTAFIDPAIAQEVAHLALERGLPAIFTSIGATH